MVSGAKVSQGSGQQAAETLVFPQERQMERPDLLELILVRSTEQKNISLVKMTLIPYAFPAALNQQNQ